MDSKTDVSLAPLTVAETGPLVIAIVSGKGGSGKTVVASTMAEIIADGASVLLVDADFATGGMTYYLGFRLIRQVSSGISDLMVDDSRFGPGYDPGEFFRSSRDLKFKFLPIGNHRLILKKQLLREEISERLKDVLRTICKSQNLKYVIVDCRGGIDEESIAVCEIAHQILLIVETDATSIQSSQYLVDVISERRLSHKLRGFIMNKVFDNPLPIAQTSAPLFRSSYLGAIPFDLPTVRQYVLGAFPDKQSLFYRQLRYITKDRVLDSIEDSKNVPPITDEQISELSPYGPDDRIGSAVSLMGSFLAFIIGIAYANEAIGSYRGDSWQFPMFLAFVASVVLSLSTVRRKIGRLVRVLTHLARPGR
jgi:MinD-like ATPase involved in chromosome partitioning or flagellar assembly